MATNYNLNDFMDTFLGRDILTELSSLSWKIPVFKQIDLNGISISTHIGLKRNRNEDRFAVCLVSTKSSDKYFLSIICDGVGGSQDGDIAATMVIASLVEEIVNCDSSQSLSLITNDIINKTDRKIALSLQGRGLTTLSLVIAKFGTSEILAANVGDSRIYNWNSSTYHLEQVSVDDTFENELKGTVLENSELLDARGLRGTLSQAIGEVNRDQNPLKVNIYDLSNNVFKGAILATDGAWKSDELAFELISKNANTSLDVARRVATYSTWVGGIDNVSIIAIDDFNFLNQPLSTVRQFSSPVPNATIWAHDAKLIHTFYPEPKKLQLENTKIPKSAISKVAKKFSSKSKQKNTKDPQFNLVLEKDSVKPTELVNELEISFTKNKNEL